MNKQQARVVPVHIDAELAQFVLNQAIITGETPGTWLNRFVTAELRNHLVKQPVDL